MAKYDVSWSLPYTKSENYYSTRKYKSFASAKKRMFKELVRLLNILEQEFEEDKFEFRENEFEVVVSYNNQDTEEILLIIYIEEYDD